MTTLDGLLNGIDLTLFCAKKCQVNSVQETIKRRHLFARYSIVFPFVSVSQRENDGKHIEKR